MKPMRFLALGALLLLPLCSCTQTQASTVTRITGGDMRYTVAMVDPAHDDLTLHWLHRGAAVAGTTDLLRDAVRGWKLPTGNVFAWVGAERAAAFGIKEDLLARGLNPETMRVTAYWTK